MIVGIIYKLIKNKKDFNFILKKKFLLLVYKCEFLLCKILSENYDERALLISFLLSLIQNIND
jgi:hypothetical protein